MQIVVIAKPPGDGTGLTSLEAALVGVRAAGHAVSLRETAARGDAARLAGEAARSGAELVIAVGGDGTVNEVVNGLASLPAPPRLGIVPAGTANDFARALGLPHTAAGAIEVAVAGCEEAVDVARVNERWFVNVSTGGFGASVTRQARTPLKRLLGPVAYALSGLKRLREFEPARARFEVDGKLLHEGRFVFFAVGNSWRTGGGTRVTPRAEKGDGLLDVAVVGDVSRLELLTLLPDLRRGTHLEHPDVMYVRARAIRVEAEQALQVNADGEPVSARVLEYRVAAGRLRLMVPA